MDILLLDGVPVVLEGANQVTPRMDSVDMVVYSTAQYVPERLNTSCVRGHGRPYHHPDSVLLQELLPMSIGPACSLVQHWHNIRSPTVQVTVHQLPPDCLAVHGPSVLSLGRSGSSRSGLGSVLGVITADGSIMSGRRHPRCSMSRPVGSGSSDPHTPLETINSGAEHLQGGGDTLDRNTGVHHPNVEVSVFFVKA